MARQVTPRAGGALQRLDDLQAVGVGEPDVEADVDVPLGGVDVGDHVVDDVVAVAEELAACCRRPPGSREIDWPTRKSGMQSRGHARLVALALVAADRGEGGQPRHRALEAGDAAAADVGLAEEDVGEHADDRRDDDDDDPGEARGGLAVRAQQRAADEEDLQRDVERRAAASPGSGRGSRASWCSSASRRGTARGQTIISLVAVSRSSGQSRATRSMSHCRRVM